MRTRCLCQICTCGRHHCPQGATKIYDHAGVFYPTTEYLEKYPTYGGVLPPPSLKPKQQFQACRGKMEGITTFKSDYRPYEVVQPSRHIPEEYKPKQGKIDFGTTYKQDFNSYQVQPVAIVRPLERQQLKKGKLDTVPTYKDDYRPWELQKRELCKPEHTYHPPTVRFGNATTFQDDFVPRPLESRFTRRKWAHGPQQEGSSGCRPVGAALRGPCPFQGSTIYSVDFTPKQLEACPASDPSPRGYKFETTDSQGHRFFRKITV
ncbi:stabilizer of axonemal microtubules 2 [Perognathus longimembris pacificus]|uniref:stabilizer of axonemal microtubules 2 n=1 Tax=Perognathus longimembris pacificus TaxID=214514 RepID=UPI00201874EF|nr:stabilizer of axonemal microtubules 2 [Perognathus longimembris pacificus]